MTRTLLNLIPIYESSVGTIVERALTPQGKGIRANIAVSIAKALDPTSKIPQSTLTRLELLHYSTLIHDDIIDRSKKRRGHTSVWKATSLNKAILIGDLIAFSSFCGLDGLTDLTDGKMLDLVSQMSLAAMKVQQGQLMEQNNLYNHKLSLRHYFKVAILKTSSLIYLASYIGWLYGSDKRETVNLLKSFSRHFGIAFQIYNDIADFTGLHGKNALDDLRDGVISLPVLLYLRMYRQSGKISAMRVFSECTGVDSDIAEAIRSSGAIETAVEICSKFADKAQIELARALGGSRIADIESMLDRFRSGKTFEEPRAHEKNARYVERIDDRPRAYPVGLP